MITKIITAIYARRELAQIARRRIVRAKFIFRRSVS